MKRRMSRLLGLHAEPPRVFNWLLAAVPFIILIAVYLVASDIRLDANPSDKLLPPISKMVDAVERLAFEPDKRTGEYILVTDTLASLKRIGAGVFLAACTGLLLGMNMGLFPGMRAIALPFVTFLSIIPPLSILPILFVTLGVDEVAKISLIFIGTVMVITRDIYLATKKIPREQITKALTLGGSELAVVYRVVLPQVMPRLIDATRLTLGAAWLFLIASEAIASTEGLGYRIFLMRRYLAMDVIIPYILWITLLGFLMDLSLRKIVEWRYRWYIEAE